MEVSLIKKDTHLIYEELLDIEILKVNSLFLVLSLLDNSKRFLGG